MMFTSYYPVLMTGDVQATRDFYEQLFGFNAVFVAAWYVHLQHAEQAWVNLAILDKDHESIPAGYAAKIQGGLLNFEVEDANAWYEKLRGEDVEIVTALRDEAFGQRHFMIVDPNGLLVDVIQMIPATGKYEAMYA